MPIMKMRQGPIRYGKLRGKMLFEGRDGDYVGLRSEHQGNAVIKLAETILDTDGAGGTETASGAIPAGAQVLGVVGVVTEPIVGVTTNFDVGDGSNADLWANNVLLVEGSSWGQGDATADPAGTWSASARDVVLTADAGSFTSGQVRIEVYYIDVGAPVN